MSIRVVLVDPNHPGNIGAVARAMKNMGLNELHLVRPKAFPHAEATARASGADDVLDAARVHEEFDDGSKIFDMISKGWPAVLSSLKTYLETGRGLKSTWDEDAAKRAAAAGA